MMKSIFITGASAGIGKATAILFASKGWFVGITDVNEESLGDLKEELGEAAVYAASMDVTDADRVKEVMGEFSRAAGGKIDVLFNNAGILRIKPFEDIPLADHQAIVDINNKGVLNCTYLAFPYLKKSEAAHVITMASMASIMAMPTETTYSASKFWVKGFTEALNMEWDRHGIHVCDIMPNFVGTSMVKQNPSRIIDRTGVSLTPDDVAEAVWKMAHCKRIHWVLARPIGRLYCRLRWFFPSSLERLLLKRLAGV